MQILEKNQADLLGRIKLLLLDYLDASTANQPTETRLIQNLLLQLDDLFLIVVAGEYNSGKSAFINALLGADYLKTGITPTTQDITILRYGGHLETRKVSAGETIVLAPAPLLRVVSIVDTPGTNAIQREHEKLTNEFIPRSDMVIFITSVDRPFTESERIFLETIRNWGKKIVILINKVDILASEQDSQEVMEFVRINARKLLGIEPKVFFISARDSLKHKKEHNYADLNLAEIETFIENTLNPKEQIPVKLNNPLGVLDNLINQRQVVNREKLELIENDIQLLADIEKQIDLFREDMNRNFKFRYSEIDNILLEFEKRGLEFFDRTFRIARIMDLLNKEKIQNEYNQQVLKGLSQEIDGKVENFIDWLVAEDLRQWQTITSRIDQRIMKHQDRILDNPEARQIQFERKKIVDSVRRESQRVVEMFDKEDESKKIAEEAQMAVAASAAIEVGALGLGTLVTILATTASADLTGILLAGLTATLGFFIIPAKKNQVRSIFSEKIGSLRKRLAETLTNEFGLQIDHIITRISDTISPYSRFVRSEQNLLEGHRDKFLEFKDRISVLKDEITHL